MKFFIYPLFAISFALAPLQSIEARKYESAHIIPLSRFRGHTYVILGLTKKGELDDFGGFRNSGETDPKVTAAREAEEETLGVLGSKTTLRKRLTGPIYVVDMNRGHPHYILPARDYGPIVSKFNKRRYGKTKLSPCQKEMVELMAIRIEKVREGVKYYNGRILKLKGPNGKLYPVRRGTSGSLIRAVKRGYL